MVGLVKTCSVRPGCPGTGLLARMVTEGLVTRYGFGSNLPRTYNRIFSSATAVLPVVNDCA